MSSSRQIGSGSAAFHLFRSWVCPLGCAAGFLEAAVRILLLPLQTLRRQIHHLRIPLLQTPHLAEEMASFQ
jgi:hypothetical protein